MNTRIIIATAALLFGLAAEAFAQELPRKVKNVEVLDLDGKPATLPMWGKKNLMIFYVDPDHHRQNAAFTEEMEANHRAEGDNLYGFGVINAKDAPFYPNSLIRSMAAKRTAKNGATVLADQTHALATAWDLGDCNNLFVLMIVTREGELVYIHRGEYTEAEKEEFYRFIEPYK